MDENQKKQLEQDQARAIQNIIDYGNRYPDSPFDAYFEYAERPRMAAPTIQKSVPSTIPVAPAPTQPRYMDALNQFSVDEVKPDDVIHSMDLLNRGEEDQRYNAGIQQRTDNRQQYAQGQGIGTLLGLLAGGVAGNNAEQQMSNYLPALQAHQAWMGKNAQEDQLARQDHATALKNYYDAMFNVRKENDAIRLHNQEMGLGLYKADMARKDGAVDKHIGSHVGADGIEYIDMQDHATGEIYQVAAGKARVAADPMAVLAQTEAYKSKQDASKRRNELRDEASKLEREVGDLMAQTKAAGTDPAKVAQAMSMFNTAKNTKYVDQQEAIDARRRAVRGMDDQILEADKFLEPNADHSWHAKKYADPKAAKQGAGYSGKVIAPGKGTGL